MCNNFLSVKNYLITAQKINFLAVSQFELKTFEIFYQNFNNVNGNFFFHNFFLYNFIQAISFFFCNKLIFKMSQSNSFGLLWEKKYFHEKIIQEIYLLESNEMQPPSLQGYMTIQIWTIEILTIQILKSLFKRPQLKK